MRSAASILFASFAVLLGGCDAGAPAGRRATPGARLEAAALAAGLIADAAMVSEVGLWGRGGDRVCIVPTDDGERIGVVVDYGSGQGCDAAGTVTRTGERLDISLPGCRFAARLTEQGIAFPVVVPPGCADLCVGRASLAAVRVGRVGYAASEARTLRSRRHVLLCST